MSQKSDVSSWLIDSQHVLGIIMPIVMKTRIFKTACGVCLVVLAALAWTWDVNSEHRVRNVTRLSRLCRITSLTLCTLLTSQIHTTAASTTSEPFASSGLKVRPQCGLSDVENPLPSPCPYIATGLMIGWWMPVKGARVSSPRFLGELSDRGLVTCILVFVCNTSWVGTGQPKERTGPLCGHLAGAVDAGACGGEKLCLAVGHLKFGLGCGTIPCFCKQDLGASVIRCGRQWRAGGPSPCIWFTIFCLFFSVFNVFFS
jgi:hypothetical protein